jgi:hypothetical protein
MTKTANLFPPEKYHDIGPFRFPVYNDLTPAESRVVTKIAKAQAQSSTEAIALARKIAKAQGIPTMKAMELMRNLRDPENEGILFDYFDEIQELNTDTSGGEEARNEICTVVLQMRGQLRNPETGEYDAVPDWTSDDTDSVPSKILNEIHQYVMYEQNGWPNPKPPEVELQQEEKPTRYKKA